MTIRTIINDSNAFDYTILQSMALHGYFGIYTSYFGFYVPTFACNWIQSFYPLDNFSIPSMMSFSR